MATDMRRSNVVATTFTHHQKCVILDTGDTGSQALAIAAQRRVTAFVGGIDLTTGAALRWDGSLIEDKIINAG